MRFKSKEKLKEIEMCYQENCHSNGRRSAKIRTTTESTHGTIENKTTTYYLHTPKEMESMSEKTILINYSFVKFNVVNFFATTAS